MNEMRSYVGSDAYGLERPHSGRCEERAEFEITDPLDPNPDTKVAYACEAHVSALLRHADAVEDVGHVESWTVRWMKENVRT